MRRSPGREEPENSMPIARGDRSATRDTADTANHPPRPQPTLTTSVGEEEAPGPARPPRGARAGELPDATRHLHLLAPTEPTVHLRKCPSQPHGTDEEEVEGLVLYALGLSREIATGCSLTKSSRGGASRRKEHARRAAAWRVDAQLQALVGISSDSE